MEITRGINLTVFAAFSVVLLPTLLHAQAGPVVTPSYVDADVREVLRTVADVSETNIMIQEGVQGTITFRSDTPMTPDEFRAAIVDHLLGLGYEITEQDGVLLVGPMKPKSSAP